ncbi:MAG: ABC transporter ATP-binding protein/permease [Lachnospiraceae bacterium]|nr:ABC transporter ATP-binding protein/permease [Lachnospiraceae bacterium]
MNFKNVKKYCKLTYEVFKISPVHFIFIYVLFGAGALTSALGVPALQMVIDSLTKFNINHEKMHSVFLAVIILFAVKMLNTLFSYLAGFLGETYDLKSYKHLLGKFIRRCGSLSCIDYEDKNTYELISKAESGVKGAISFINVVMDLITNYAVYLTVIAVYLIRVNSALIFVLLLILFTVIIEQKIKTGLYSKTEDLAASDKVQSEYYADCLLTRDMVKENKTNGFEPFLLKKLNAGLKNISELKNKETKKATGISLLSNMAVILEYLGTIVILSVCVIRGSISVGAFAAIFYSVDELFSMLENLLYGRLKSFSETMGKMNNYIIFIDADVEKEDKGCISGQKAVMFNNVSFKYPGSSNLVLEKITFKVDSRETIAIVGENGSGKTTLARLLLGLFKPFDGNIINPFETDNSSAVFQDHAEYPVTLSENITFSDKADRERVSVLSKKSGITEDKDTVLSVELGGKELSGGNLQKVAIARALYKNHDLLVLDEPTSALDPISEIEMYKTFEKLTKDKTAFIITHRLGSVKFADRIMVMKNGRLVGFGTHEELINTCGYYGELWNKA